MEKEDLQRRLRTYALRVIALVHALPVNPAGRAIGNQLIRSGTSVGANYRAACRARSRSEFIAKIGIVVEEVDESAYWIDLISDAQLISGSRVTALRKETNEILAIMIASRKTAERSPSTIGNRQ